MSTDIIKIPLLERLDETGRKGYIIIMKVVKRRSYNEEKRVIQMWRERIKESSYI